jgi:hypothetical protein
MSRGIASNVKFGNTSRNRKNVRTQRSDGSSFGSSQGSRVGNKHISGAKVHKVGVNVRIPKQLTAQEQAEKNRILVDSLRKRRSPRVLETDEIIRSISSNSSRSLSISKSQSSSSSLKRDTNYVRKDRKRRGQYKDDSNSRVRKKEEPIDKRKVKRNGVRKPRYKPKDQEEVKTQGTNDRRSFNNSKKRVRNVRRQRSKRKEKNYNNNKDTVVIRGKEFFVSKKNGLFYDKDAFRYPDSTENIVSVGSKLKEMNLPVNLIVDAFAGCGGDLSNLCSSMDISKAYAFEIDPCRDEILATNVNVEEFMHYNTEHEMSDDFRSGMLYLDPVWDEYYRDNVQDLMQCDYPYVLLKNKGHRVVKYTGYVYTIIEKFTNVKRNAKDVKWLYVLYTLDTKSISIVEDDDVLNVCPYFGKESEIDCKDLYLSLDYVENYKHNFGKNRKNYILDMDAVSTMLDRARDKSKKLALVYIGSGNPMGGSLLHMKEYLDMNDVFVISIDIQSCMSGYLRIETPVSLDNIEEIEVLVSNLSQLDYYVGLLFDMRSQEDLSLNKKGNPGIDEQFRLSDLDIIEALDTCGFNLCSYKVADFWTDDASYYLDKVVSLRFEDFKTSPYMCKNSEGRIITSDMCDYVDIDIIEGDCQYSINKLTIGGLAFKHKCGGCYSCNFFDDINRIHPYSDYVLPIRNQSVYTFDDVGKISVLAVPNYLRTISRVGEIVDLLSIRSRFKCTKLELMYLEVHHEGIDITMSLDKWLRLDDEYSQFNGNDSSSTDTVSDFDASSDLAVDDNNDMILSSSSSCVSERENDSNGEIKIDYQQVANFLGS